MSANTIRGFQLMNSSPGSVLILLVIFSATGLAGLETPDAAYFRAPPSHLLKEAIRTACHVTERGHVAGRNPSPILVHSHQNKRRE